MPPYRFVFRKETDRIEKPWYPEGAVHRGEYALDTEKPFNGRQSQRIKALPGDPCTLGISQAGKFVRQGLPMKCSLYLRMQGLSNPVQRDALRRRKDLRLGRVPPDARSGNASRPT